MYSKLNKFLTWVYYLSAGMFGFSLMMMIVLYTPGAKEFFNNVVLTIIPILGVALVHFCYEYYLLSKSTLEDYE